MLSSGILPFSHSNLDSKRLEPEEFAQSQFERRWCENGALLYREVEVTPIKLRRPPAWLQHTVDRADKKRGVAVCNDDME